MLPEPGPGKITDLLHQWSDGDADAFQEMLPLIYEKLRGAASRQLKGEAPGHSIQTTALVHEVYLELVKGKNLKFENRAQFFFFASKVMRHILIRNARMRLAAKRGGGELKIILHEGESKPPSMDFSDLLALDEALTRLEKLDPRQAQIVQLRYFAGLREEEIARILGTSLRTVQRDWNTAKLWLCRALGG